MRTLFDAAGLLVTEQFVRAGERQYPISEIEHVRSVRPRGGRPPTWALVSGGVFLAAAVAGCVWLANTNPPLLWAGIPALILFVLFGGPLDLVTNRIENRPWHLLVKVRGQEHALLEDNSVEVNKAVRAIMRAREYAHEASVRRTGRSGPAAR